MNDLICDDLNFVQQQNQDKNIETEARIEASRIEKSDYDEHELFRRKEAYKDMMSQMSSSVSRVLGFLIVMLVLISITTLIWPNNTILGMLAILLLGMVLGQLAIWAIIRFSTKHNSQSTKRRSSKAMLRSLVWTEGTYGERIPENISLSKEDIEEMRKINLAIKISPEK